MRNNISEAICYTLSEQIASFPLVNEMMRTGNWQKRAIITNFLILSALWLALNIYPFYKKVLNSVGLTFFDNNEVVAAETDDVGAVTAFNAIADVFASPRCTNCHAAGDNPTQDDEGRLHDLNVVRGSTGRGKGPGRCNTCHQMMNLAGDNGAPGSPDWRMPPPETPMTFAGKTTGEICRQIKDPEQNGNKTLEDLTRHAEIDPRIQWAWNPGGNRTSAPRTYQDFVAKLTEWANKGGACPE